MEKLPNKIEIKIMDSDEIKELIREKDMYKDGFYKCLNTYILAVVDRHNRSKSFIDLRKHFLKGYKDV